MAVLFPAVDPGAGTPVVPIVPAAPVIARVYSVPARGRLLRLGPGEYERMGRPGETECAIRVAKTSPPYRRDGSVFVDVRGYRETSAGMRSEPVYLTVRLGLAPTRPHQPRRPVWVCWDCPGETPWPCEPARVEFLAYYGGARLMLFMELTDYFEAAVDDFWSLTRTVPDDLYERIVRWARAHFPNTPAK